MRTWAETEFHFKGTLAGCDGPFWLVNLTGCETNRQTSKHTYNEQFNWSRKMHCKHGDLSLWQLEKKQVCKSQASTFACLPSHCAGQLTCSAGILLLPLQPVFIDSKALFLQLSNMGGDQGLSRNPLVLLCKRGLLRHPASRQRSPQPLASARWSQTLLSYQN